MALTMKERHSVVKELSRGYLRSRKKNRGHILDELVSLTGYNRDYAALLLRGYAHGTVYGPEGVLMKPSVSRTRCRARIYGEDVHKDLSKIWAIYDCHCGKYMAPGLKEMIRVLEREKEIKLTDDVRQKLLRISPATIDRLLAKEKRSLQIRGRTHTSAGPLLKHQIPIRTFADWDDHRPGYLEIDLVGHEGGNAKGDYSYTLTATDIHSAWTEVRIVQNKAQKWVFQAILDIRAKLPFPVLGIDSDNGSEFINDQLMRYCKKENIQFTRSRPMKKNDNCYVEQKNNSVVRRAVGYLRYETDEARSVIGKLYQALNPSVNFFYPVRKVVSKTRKGAKQSRHYDTPATPYQRLLRCQEISEETKNELVLKYESLNPAKLKRTISKLQQLLWRAAGSPPRKMTA